MSSRSVTAVAGIRRVFVLGPSHKVPLSQSIPSIATFLHPLLPSTHSSSHHSRPQVACTGCHLSPYSSLSTPIRPLPVDTEVIKRLQLNVRAATNFPAFMQSQPLLAWLFSNEQTRRRPRAQARQLCSTCQQRAYRDTHRCSLELHYPFIAALFDPTVQLVPIMVGDVRGSMLLLLLQFKPMFHFDLMRSTGTLQQCAAALSPFFHDPQNFFVISSDFCHWCPACAPSLP